MTPTPALLVVSRMEHTEVIRQYDSFDTGQFRQREHQAPAEVLSQLDDTSNSPLYGEYKCCWRGGLWCPCGGLWCRMWKFSIFIGNRRKHKTTDIRRCANGDQCVPDKTSCFCRRRARIVRLARQGCWCCACQSGSPALHKSCYQIPSIWGVTHSIITRHVSAFREETLNGCWAIKACIKHILEANIHIFTKSAS